MAGPGEGGAHGGGSGGNFLMRWRGWQDRVAADPSFPYKVFIEQAPPLQRAWACRRRPCLAGSAVSKHARLCAAPCLRVHLEHAMPPPASHLDRRQVCKSAGCRVQRARADPDPAASRGGADYWRGRGGGGRHVVAALLGPVRAGLCVLHARGALPLRAGHLHPPTLSGGRLASAGRSSALSDAVGWQCLCYTLRPRAAAVLLPPLSCMTGQYLGLVA